MAAENVKTRTSRKPKKQGLSTAANQLKRATFRTSREMGFFSEKELVTQTGHEITDWPLVFIKELVDNALDACEEADIAPIINVTADATGIGVTDNGPGLPEETLQGAMDFTVRASSREAYVAPDRGAQGNALKTILPMPYVLDPRDGRLLVQAHGKRHVIQCGSDPISQRAVIHADVENVRNCTSRNGEKASFLNGTEVRMRWSPQYHGDDVVWPFDDLYPLETDRWSSFSKQFRSVVEGFSIFNPHAAFTLDWFGEEVTWEATNVAWGKWKPNRPTSPHWYEPLHLERLIGAYITHDRDTRTDRLVSDFIAEFDGLTGSGKRSKVLAEAGLKRVRLSELVTADQLNSTRIAELLAAMKRHTRPVKSQRLGIIGAEHLTTRLYELGAMPDSVQYTCKRGKEGLPWVLESAFGWLGDESEDRRRIFAGANWSAAIKNPFRSFGSTGEGLEAALNEQRAGRSEPIVFVLHLAHPRVEYTDRGKSALVVGDEQ